MILKVGQDRIEKILTSSQFQALAKGFSIDLKSIQFSSKQTASVAELNRKFLEATAAASINQINNNSNSEVRLFVSKRWLIFRVPYLFIVDNKGKTKQFQGRQSRFEADKTAITLTPRSILQNPGKTAV